MNEDESIRFAAKYLEDLLSFFGVNVAVTSTIEDDVIQLGVPSTSLNGLLIGRGSENLRALQRIVTGALKAKEAEVTRVAIDIAGRRRMRADRVTEWAEEWFEEVRRTGKPKRVNLNPADRRVVHKLAQDYSDLETHSEGEGKERVLIIEKVTE